MSCGNFSQVLTKSAVEQLPQISEPGYLRALALIENKALLLQPKSSVLFDVIRLNCKP